MRNLDLYSERTCAYGHTALRYANYGCPVCARVYPNQKKLATPVWCEKEKIKVVHEQRKKLQTLLGCKLAVDHIIPIVSDTVCGLHCWANLQIIGMKENTKKGQYYQTDW